MDFTIPLILWLCVKPSSLLWYQIYHVPPPANFPYNDPLQWTISTPFATKPGHEGAVRGPTTESPHCRVIYHAGRTWRTQRHNDTQSGLFKLGSIHTWNQYQTVSTFLLLKWRGWSVNTLFGNEIVNFCLYASTFRFQIHGVIESVLYIFTQKPYCI